MGVAGLWREMQMKKWEFLLQREGDTTWLPLETPDVEILEGRYRVVARSGYPNAKIEVRIIHHALEEAPPVRRTQTRTTNTSAEGLLVVIPYTRLKPGTWELSCTPHQPGVLVSKSSDHQVKLRVLSNDSEPLEQPQVNDNSFTSESEDVETPDLSQEEEEMTPTTSTDDALQEQDIENDQQVIVVELSRDDSPVKDSSERSVSPDDLLSNNVENQESVTSESLSDLEVTNLQLTLEKDYYVAKLGQALLISGWLENAESSDQTDTPSLRLSIDQPRLHVYLRDPSNSNILLQVQQPIPLSVIPLPFSCLVYLPFECQTRLILGEIMISSNGVPVTSNLFTIATQVEHLLEAIETIETEVSAEEDLDIAPEEFSFVEPTSPRLHLIDPNASPTPEPQTSEPDLRRPTVPVTQFTAQTSPAPTPSSLELPSFGHFRSSENGDASQAAEPASTPNSIEAEMLTPSVEPNPEAIADEDFQESEEAQLVQVTPVDPAFQSLNLENRFWSRLNALAQDRDLSQWMKQAKPTPLPETSFIQTRVEADETATPPPSVQADPLFVSIEDDLESQEIVVDDDEVQEVSALSASSSGILRVVDSRFSPPLDADNTVTLSEDEPIVPPFLEVMNPEIVAGRTVKVRVCLPENLPRIYVKIWVYDRQSRTIVDGPRWLTEFSPNGLNQIETTVNLEIAYGSLEVQFEAIAVEMQTQRESHKVIVERSVVPPAAPTLPLDEK